MSDEKELERLKKRVEKKISALGVSTTEANHTAEEIMDEVELSLELGKLGGWS